MCRQRFRQSARRPTEVAFDDDAGAALVEDDDAPTADDIRRALGHLAFNQRAALVMRELEGRSYAEIAEILELSPSAVETLIFRARRALREQLESSLTCGEAELAISRQLDGRLPRGSKAALRAHLRECRECATFARRQRAQRAAIRSLAAIPVPTSLTSLFGGGGAAVGTGLAVKAAVAVTAGVAIGGAGYAGVQEAVEHHTHAKQPAATSGTAPHVARRHATQRAAAVHSRAAVKSRRSAVHGLQHVRTRKVHAHIAGRAHVARREHVARARAHGRVHSTPHAGNSVQRAQTPPARGHVTHVQHSQRPSVPPGRTKSHHVAHSASHGGGAGQPNGHGK